MGVVSDEDFQKELKNSSTERVSFVKNDNKVITGEVVDSPSKGRGNGNVAVPDSIRKVIGETSELEGRSVALEFAKSLGISPSSVSAYAAGATSTATYDKPKESIVNHIVGAKQKVANTAMNRLRRSLNVLTEEKIKTGTAREVAAIAKDMAAIVKVMEPENNSDNGNKPQPQFIVYAPQFKSESHFETIIAKDNF